MMYEELKTIHYLRNASREWLITEVQRLREELELDLLKSDDFLPCNKVTSMIVQARVEERELCIKAATLAHTESLLAGEPDSFRARFDAELARGKEREG